jgi:hypothetical protein
MPEINKASLMPRWRIQMDLIDMNGKFKRGDNPYPASPYLRGGWVGLAIGVGGRKACS